MKAVLKYERNSRDTKTIFSILAKKKIKIIKTSDFGEVTIYIKNYDDLNKYQLTVYEDYKVPSWFKEGVLYHVFVDRFNNGNRSGKVDNPKKNSFLYGNWEDDPMYIKDQNEKS